MAILEKLADGSLAFYCPGCQTYHSFDSRWSFNGSMEKPTFTPSLKVGPWWGMPPEADLDLRDENGNRKLDENGRIFGAQEMLCHSFVTDGMIRFLPDCTHPLAGKTVPIPDISSTDGNAEE